MSTLSHPREDRLNHATLARLRGERNYRYVSTLSHPREHGLDHATLARLQSYNFCDQCCIAKIYSATCSARGTDTCLCIPKYKK